MRGSRGEGIVGRDPPESYKFIGFLSNTCLDLLNITKLPSQHSIWVIIGPPAGRHFNGVLLGANDGPLIVVFGSSLPLLTKKTCQSWTPSDKIFLIRARNSSFFLSKMIAKPRMNTKYWDQTQNAHFYDT